MKVDRKYPFQFKLASGELVTVHTEDKKEYKFDVIKKDGTTLNFSWFDGDINNPHKKVKYNREKQKILDAFIYLESKRIFS